MATNPTNPVPAGNTFDKYASRNPISRRLVDGFLRAHEELLAKTTASGILDIGCGEGFLLSRIRSAHPTSRLLAMDLDEGVVREANNLCPEPHYLQADAQYLPLRDGCVELVVACEVLEHVPSPGKALQEIHRVLASGGYLLASVPWEPVWRILNLARAKYVSALGNTPGHINHFRRREFRQLVQQFGFEIVEVRRPLPWTFLLARRMELQESSSASAA